MNSALCCFSPHSTMMVVGNFCEPGVSMQRVWLDGGLTLCFFFTLVPCVLVSLAVLSGALHCFCYARHGTRMEARFVPRSRLYTVQVGVSVLLVFQALVWMGLRLALGERVPGYVVLYGGLYALAWAWATGLLSIERRRVLVRDRTRGHSALLLLYWTLAFAAENLALVSWSSSQWWWQRQGEGQQVGVQYLHESIQSFTRTRPATSF